MAEKIIEKVTSDEVSQPLCKVVAVIPAYNEERFIGSIVLKVKEYVREVIVVDDGSMDKTAKVAELAGAIVVN
ncbi:MAG: glycosyltransferase, partial [Anaerolineales bacterium]